MPTPAGRPELNKLQLSDNEYTVKFSVVQARPPAANGQAGEKLHPLAA